MNPRNAISLRIALVPLALLLLGAPTLAADHFVTANPDNTFTPEVLNIQPGDSVTWTNEGGLHNVAAPGLFRCANGCDGDGMGGNGDPAVNPWSFTLTFDDPGVIDYVCEVHEGLGMVGTINVLGDAPTLTINGACPGTITLSVTGGTPSGSIALISSASQGNSSVPAGSCAGTPLDLSSPSLLAIVPLDANGGFSIQRNVAAALCGRFIQVLDLSSCQTSNVAQIP